MNCVCRKRRGRMKAGEVGTGGGVLGLTLSSSEHKSKALIVLFLQENGLLLYDVVTTPEREREGKRDKEREREREREGMRERKGMRGRERGRKNKTEVQELERKKVISGNYSGFCLLL